MRIYSEPLPPEKYFVYREGVRIRMKCDFMGVRAGMAGTVLINDSYVISGVLCGTLGVRFDDRFSGGHSLYGLCGAHEGYWVYPCQVEIISEDDKK